MNLQSEIDYYSEMRIADKARLMASFLSELTDRGAAPTYGAALDSVHDGCAPAVRQRNVQPHHQAHRAVPGRRQVPPGRRRGVAHAAVAARRQGSPRRWSSTAYRRALQNFERYDTTVFLSS